MYDSTQTCLVGRSEKGDVGLAVFHSSHDAGHLLDEAEEGGEALALRISSAKWIDLSQAESNNIMNRIGKPRNMICSTY